MAVIAITGRKGGIGKSTVTANLAAEFVAMGKSVVVLDTDPQKSLKEWAGLGDGVLASLVEAVDIEHPEHFTEAVAKASARADIVLIDTPPGFADPALLAALLSDLVLLPAGPSALDIMAVRDAMEIARQAQSERKNGKPLIRFVPSKVVARTKLSVELPGSLAAMGEPVLPGIGQRTVVAEATLSGLTVREFARTSHAAEEFETLARAVEELVR
jgi:chromosome partitioning protein